MDQEDIVIGETTRGGIDEIDSLIRQKESIEQKIDEVIRQKRAEAIGEVKKIVDYYKLTPKDVFEKQKRQKAEAKYRDPVTGKTWSGRGRAPSWFDKSRPEAFKV